MTKYVLGIDGMMCGMCEMHVEDAINKVLRAKKCRANHLKNEVVVIVDLDLYPEDFKEMLSPTGYRLTSFQKQEAKKGLFGWK